jgi:hypothetical protein
MYLKFDLPDAVAGMVVTSATLYGYYYSDTHNPNDVEHTLYLAGDKLLNGTTSWTEENLTWDTQPNSSTWLAVGTWLPTGSTAGTANFGWKSWDVTNVVNQEYLGDNIISFLMKPTTEASWAGELFYSKEYGSGNMGFYLDITLGKPPSSVPEPSTFVLLGIGLAGLVGLRKKF